MRYLLVAVLTLLPLVRVAANESPPADEAEKTEKDYADEKRDLLGARAGLKRYVDERQDRAIEGKKKEIEEARKKADEAREKYDKAVEEKGGDSIEAADAWGDVMDAENALARLEDEYEVLLEQLLRLGAAWSDADIALREHCNKWGNDIDPSPLVPYDDAKYGMRSDVEQRRLACEYYARLVQKLKEQAEAAQDAWDKFREDHDLGPIDSVDGLGGIADELRGEAESLFYALQGAQYAFETASEMLEFMIGVQRELDAAVRLHCEGQADDGQDD